MGPIVLGPPLLERRELADVAFRHLLIHTLGAPVLVFDEQDQAAAACIRWRMQEKRVEWRKARDEKRRIAAAVDLRKFHRALVNDSIGITWADCRAFGRRYVYVWRDDPPPRRGALRELCAQFDRRGQSARSSHRGAD